MKISEYAEEKARIDYDEDQLALRYQVLAREVANVMSDETLASIFKRSGYKLKDFEEILN